MYAVGRLSSYITRGVSTVSGPFHPFGGAIDIIVVQQQDGSLKSSPWYVRFGKFQGVLKVKERVVDIHVNGVKTNFHMYLNPRGEAYFLRESSDSESKIQDCDFDKCHSLIDVNNGKSFSRTLGFTLDRKATNDDNLSNEGGSPIIDMKSAEIAADLLEMNWSTSLSNKTKNQHLAEHVKYDEEVTSGKLESSLVLHEQHFVQNPKDDETDSKVAKEVDKVIIANVDSDGIVKIYENCGGSLGNNVSKEEPLNVVERSYTQVSCIRKENINDEIQENRLKSNGQVQEGSLMEQRVTFGDLDDRNSLVDHGLLHSDNGSSCTFDQDSVNSAIEGLNGNIRKFSSESDIVKSYKLIEEQNVPHTKSLPNMISNFDESSLYPVNSRQRFSRWDMLRKDASKIINEVTEHPNLKNGDTLNNADDTSKSWGLWPFRKSKSKRFSQKEQMCKKDSDFDSGLEVDSEIDNSTKSRKIYKGLTPTAEQLQSMNLTEGKNTVTFKFSTAVLGNQHVDARIFLWRWDTHIVISDVDGTITKSDVLGQFMPMVGKDWSHIGVTNLFSAIKENGYEILFLSARSISQADVTRQFLIHLKQDGKTLPEGPVVISPDGLFPSLFREVIRRAPHEFKIACLEDIKVCFPADWNPFYAGFGNRDTDEFSYLKVGIPKGRIFIINPKGEVVVNRCNDTKSYNSLHSIVNETFPPKSEQGGC